MELKKNLKFIQVFSITVGSMMSSGIFILPSIAFDKVGPAIVVAYLIAGLCAILGSLSMIELTTAMPKAGGVYFFTSRSLGALIGTLSGILMWLAIAMKAAFAIYGLSAVVAHYTGIPFLITGIIVTLFYASLNIKGTHDAAKFDVFLVTIIIIIMIPFTIIGHNSINVIDFQPFITHHGGLNEIFGTAAFVFIAFGGIMNAANVSEEMANPKRDIPLAIFTAVCTVLVLYTIILITAIGVLPGKEFATSINPIADAGRIIMGTPGFIVITIAACLAFSSCANSGIMSASRYPLALSRDNLAPKFVGKLNKKFKTPTVAILLTAGLIILSLTLDLHSLVEGASTIILTSYLLTDLAVIVLRKSKIQNYKPSFKVPFFPWVQIFSMLVFSFLIFHMGLEAIKISGILIGISFLVYLINIRKNKQKYALFHAFEHIKNKKITSYRLEHELKNIIHERDNIIKDEFDHAIENASVIDLEESYDKEELFKLISKKMQKSVKIPINELHRLFTKREDESSTAISDTVAIPHIILEKNDIFHTVIIRCKAGVSFSAEHPSAKTIVAVAASKNMRNLYLKTIAAIAQTVLDKNFDNNWKNAVTTKNLKDIFLLGDRKRTKLQK
jgi:basic amino acid/polyamine antiporter, APA family